MPDIDPSKIKVTGSCLETGKSATTGKKTMIHFRSEDPAVSRSALKDALTFAVDGPMKPEVLWSAVAESEPEADERMATAYFVPIKPGKYKLNVRCMGRKLRPEPFEITVGGEPLDVAKILEKVTVHGRAFELGKAFSFNEFVVDCSRVQPPLGNLKVHCKGPERASAHLKIIDNENGTFSIRYKPTQPGMYIMTVKIADTDIPGSPFQVRVTEFLSS